MLYGLKLIAVAKKAKYFVMCLALALLRLKNLFLKQTDRTLCIVGRQTYGVR